MSRKIQRYGWIPDLPDQRDYLYAAPPHVLQALPASVDLRPGCPPVYDQGQLGSCFPAGTPILLADGTERAIEKVEVGQPVITHTGDIKPVTKVYRRPYSGEMYAINIQGWQDSLTMTAEHPVAVIPNVHKHAEYGAFEAGEIIWIKAEELEPGNFVLTPYGHRDGKEQSSIEYSKILEESVFAINSLAAHYEPTEYGLACRIASITIEDAEEIPVYNLEVEDDHTYIANGIAVHNCTANAIAGAIEFDQIKQGQTPFVPSRLFIYYNEREIEGTVDSDSGAMLRDGVKSVATQGVCDETEWPYDISQFAVQPPPQCYQDALACKATLYRRIVQNLSQMKGCLASGYPFVFGFVVYESFESDEVAQTGIVPMPQYGEQILGGHAICAVGYDNTQQTFTFRNSWSASWGDQGYGYMPYTYLTNPQLASDFWTIHSVS